eukprot:TRINITY_DN29883_c0_g1_i1.p1 TRINITY_DN29883_c0_g1~~TRINITY_DN29883_c0_g1_i1.p1  ORF type:complete len:452 (-),score=124.71 TRINITY_DN29883_c0_g1_i1:249-1604(-)
MGMEPEATTLPSSLASPEESLEGYSVSTLFEKGRKIFLRAEADELPQRQDDAQAVLRQGRVLLEQCEERCEQLGLFASRNEELDDVPTSEIKYLLVPYMRGRLLERQGGDRSQRRKAIKAAQAALLSFVDRVEPLGLLPAGEVGTRLREEPADAATRRAEKIERFKRRKEHKQRLEELEWRRGQREQQKGVRGIRRQEESGDKEEEGEEAEVEEARAGGGAESAADAEDERQMALLEVRLAVDTALDSAESLSREDSMLAAAEEVQQSQPEGPLSREALDTRISVAEDFHQRSRQQAQSGFVPKSSEPIMCATFAQDIIEGRANRSLPHVHHGPNLGFGPVSLMGGARPQTHRQRVMSRVFQPSHSLPGMSVEQAGDRENGFLEDATRRQEAMMNEIAQERARNGSYEREVGEADEEEGESDEAVMKARAWDDWKDENPQGQGNSKLTPCG